MTEALCQVPTCERVVYARGHCSRHYRQLLRAGAVRPDREPVPCAVDGCGRTAVTRGWCHGHYLRWSRSGDVREQEPLARPVADRCSIPGCDGMGDRRGLCQAHNRRVTSGGDAKPDRPVRRVTGSSVSHGYRKVVVPPEERWLVGGSTSALEHRLVLARTLGRPLTSQESVHHRNGDRLDNRPANLELWSRYQPAGARVADQVAWAREVLVRHGHLIDEAGASARPRNDESPSS